jgi:hypothetical protein
MRVNRAALLGRDRDDAIGRQLLQFIAKRANPVDPTLGSHAVPPGPGIWVAAHARLIVWNR